MLLGIVALLLIRTPVAIGAASAPKADEQVVLYPTLGWRVPGGWGIEIQGCVFELEQRALTAPLLRRVLRISDDSLTTTEKALYHERARLLLVDHQDGRFVDVRLRLPSGQMPSFLLGPSTGSGRIQARIKLPDPQFAGITPNDGTLRIEALPPNATNPVLATGEIHLLGESGWSVISDVDDTLKVSDVRDRHELLYNTFCRPFRSVPGMATLYGCWASTNGAQFHYVSASPWQLYPALEGFVRSNGFPAGTFHLRQLRVKDGTVLEFKEPPNRYKRSVIVPLLQRYPGRHFVLVGDTGEKDPEIYSELAHRFPEQIRAVYLREVTGEPAGSRRYRKLFGDLPDVRWRVFTEASELPRALRR